MTTGFGVKPSRVDICLAAYKLCDLGPLAYLCVSFLICEMGKIIRTNGVFWIMSAEGLARELALRRLSGVEAVIVTPREKRALLQVWACRHEEVGKQGGGERRGSKSHSDRGNSKARMDKYEVGCKVLEDSLQKRLSGNFLDLRKSSVFRSLLLRSGLCTAPG